MGFAYAGSHRDDLLPLLLPHVADDGVSMEIVRWRLGLCL
jgi:26S proteasome regulatory subunit N1